MTDDEKIDYVLKEIETRSEARTARIYASGDPDAKYDSAAAGESMHVLLAIDREAGFDAWQAAGTSALLAFIDKKRETRGHGIGIVGSIHSDLVEIVEALA